MAEDEESSGVDDDYNSESDVGYDDGPEKKANLNQLFDDIKNGNVRDLESRVREINSLLRPGNGNGNVFHRLVEYFVQYELVHTEQVDKFVKFLNEVFQYDNKESPMLEELNVKGETPILYAISSNRVRLVERMCNTAIRLKIPLAKALAATSSTTKNNCLHEGIKNRLLYSTLAKLIENSDKTGLTTADFDGNTPLHLAMKNEFFYKKESHSDGSKRLSKVTYTPIYLVDSLVTKCPEALESKNFDKGGKGRKTPFQFLLDNRNAFQDNARRIPQKSEVKIEVTKSSDVKALASRNAEDGKKERDRADARAADRRQDAMPSSRQGDARLKDRKELDGRVAPVRMIQRSGTAHEDVEKSPSAADNYDRLQQKKEPNTKAVRDSEKARDLEKAKARTQKSKKTSLTNNDIASIFFEIEEFLWNFILRNFTVDEASKIAYGLMPSNQLDFNLLGIKRPLDFPAIRRNYNSFLVFNRILQYVALPQLLSNVPFPALNEQKPETKHDKNKSQSPTQYLEVFKWLKDKKGVSKILQIHIDDDLDHPHGDHIIEETVKDFGVELWNWRKFDISSETILAAAPKTREAILYTTGNKAVLHGWSDEQGLRRLKELEKVILYFKGSNDRGQPVDEAEVKQDVETFKTRLSALLDRDRRTDMIERVTVNKLITKYEDETPIDREKFIRELDRLPEQTDRKAINEILSTYQDTAQIERRVLLNELNELPASTTIPHEKKLLVKYYLLPFSKDSSLTLKGEKQAEQRTHKWMTCVDTCSTWLGETIRPNPSTFIKVAVIDDGVDASHEGLRSPIKTGVTYRPASMTRPTASSYYSSTRGHGTLMSILIQSVCPFVEFYIAKLDDSEDTFTPESAAKAIAWAVSMNVDIISMSWIINKDDPKVTDSIASDLDLALTDAANKGILMFCAAKDEGIDNSNRQTYPAAANPGKIFKIGAASQTGVNATTVNRAAVDFLFPGTELRESFPKLLYPAEMAVIDGSSPATALASGLAALVLFVLSKATEERWNVKKPRRHEKIDALLKYAANADKKYVQVWELFGQLEKDSKGTEDETKVLQRFVDWLINKATI